MLDGSDRNFVDPVLSGAVLGGVNYNNVPCMFQSTSKVENEAILIRTVLTETPYLFSS